MDYEKMGRWRLWNFKFRFLWGNMFHKSQTQLLPLILSILKRHLSENKCFQVCFCLILPLLLIVFSSISILLLLLLQQVLSNVMMLFWNMKLVSFSIFICVWGDSNGLSNWLWEVGSYPFWLSLTFPSYSNGLLSISHQCRILQSEMYHTNVTIFAPKLGIFSK